MQFKTPYDVANHIKVSYENGPDPDRTKQSFKDECDINNILKKYATTGILPDMIKRDPQYGDFASVPDYQEALNLVQMANQQFQNLSAKIRERFQNNPENFLRFATNPSNAKEMVSLGLASLRSTTANLDDMGGGSEGASAPKKRSAPKADPKSSSSEKGEE